MEGGSGHLVGHPTQMELDRLDSVPRLAGGAQARPPLHQR
jgi:hypothetical protein